MEYLIVYGEKEREEFELWKLSLKNREAYFHCRAEKDLYGIGLNALLVEDLLTKNRYYVLEEYEALKYYGGSALCLHNIYCTESVDIYEIKKLYESCIRIYDPLLGVGLGRYNLKGMTYQQTK